MLLHDITDKPLIFKYCRCQGKKAHLIFASFGDFKKFHKNEVIVLISLFVVIPTSFGYHVKKASSLQGVFFIINFEIIQPYHTKVVLFLLENIERSPCLLLRYISHIKASHAQRLFYSQNLPVGHTYFMPQFNFLILVLSLAYLALMSASGFP